MKHAVTKALLTVMAARYRRIAIVGGPRTGKTTISKTVTDRPVIGTDDYQDMPWEEIPGKMIEATSAAGDAFVIEGVQVARALRKGMEVDAVLVMRDPKVEQSPGQAAMGKGVMTVFNEWRATNASAVVVMEPR